MSDTCDNSIYNSDGRCGCMLVDESDICASDSSDNRCGYLSVNESYVLEDCTWTPFPWYFIPARHINHISESRQERVCVKNMYVRMCRRRDK